MTDQTRSAALGSKFTTEGCGAETRILTCNLDVTIRYEDEALREALKGRGYRYAGGGWYCEAMPLDALRQEITWLSTQGIELEQPRGPRRRFYALVVGTPAAA
jgi:hypothetical protein